MIFTATLDEFTFDEEKHEYRLNGKKMLSVTEICGMINGDKFNINESILRAAQKRGTAVHELTAMYDYDIPDLEVDPEIEPYFRAWQSFCNDYHPEWLFIERKIYDKNLMLAGTVDRVGIIDGNAVVVDIKTTANMDRTSQVSLFMQLAAYASLLILHGENERDEVDLYRSMGVQLMKDGTYKVYRYDEAVKKYGMKFLDIFYQLHQIMALTKGLINGNNEFSFNE